MTTDTPPIFAVPDIHGQAEMLRGALDRIAEDPASGSPIVFLGDYVDRGPDSAGVLDQLIAGQQAGLPWITLLGNHDRYMRNFLNGTGPQYPESLSWLSQNIGGRKTLDSYGVDTDKRRTEADIRADAISAVPAAHRAFLDRLELMHLTPAHIFVHAGIRPGVPLNDQQEHDLIWIRGDFLDDTTDHGRLVVHGHTALQGPVAYPNRVNLDGGAGFGRPLSTAVLLGREVFVLGGGGRVRL